jgi:hypothetical protein
MRKIDAVNRAHHEYKRQRVTPGEGGTQPPPSCKQCSDAGRVRCDACGGTACNECQARGWYYCGDCATGRAAAAAADSSDGNAGGAA